MPSRAKRRRKGAFCVSFFACATEAVQRKVSVGKKRMKWERKTAHICKRGRPQRICTGQEYSCDRPCGRPERELTHQAMRVVVLKSCESMLLTHSALLLSACRPLCPRHRPTSIFSIPNCTRYVRFALQREGVAHAAESNHMDTQRP